MYNVKTYDGITRVDVIWDDKQKQPLSTFLSDFDQTCFCELATAVARIKEGTLEKYGAALDQYFFEINREGIFIEYNDGFSPVEQNKYPLADLEEAMKIYVEAFQKAYEVDLTQPDEDYEPIVEGIINPSQVHDTREKRFS